MVIKTAVKPKGPNLPSKRPLGTVYEAGKYVLKTLGYYEEFKQYDPGYYYEQYIQKYTYKPRKRLTGYALSTQGFLQTKKAFKSRKYSQFNQECSKHCSWNNWNCNCSIYSTS